MASSVVMHLRLQQESELARMVNDELEFVLTCLVC